MACWMPPACGVGMMVTAIIKLERMTNRASGIQSVGATNDSTGSRRRGDDEYTQIAVLSLRGDDVLLQ